MHAVDQIFEFLPVEAFVRCPHLPASVTDVHAIVNRDEDLGGGTPIDRDYPMVSGINLFFATGVVVT